MPPASRRREGVPDDCPLTAREFEVLGLLAEGLAMKQVAAKLGIAASTVRIQAHTGYRRLGVGNVTQAVAMMSRRGWLGWTPPPPQPPVEPEGKLPPFARAYLEAFDEHLRSGSEQSRRSMRIALYGQANEAGRQELPPPVTDPLASIVDMLVHGRPWGRAEPSPGWPSRGRRPRA